MTQFINNLGQAPIYSPVTNASTSPGTPTTTNTSWQKWFNQINSYINSNNYYGNPNVLYNGDFNFNSGISYPVTSDGLISTMWEIDSAGSGITYSVTSPNVAYASSDQVGSLNYINITVSDFTDLPFSIYQKPTQNGGIGWNYLHRLQGRNVSCSGIFNNNQAQTIAATFTVTFNFDGVSVAYTNTSTAIATGNSEYSTNIQIPYITSSYTVNSSSTVTFSLVFTGLGGSTMDLDIYYLKLEIADTPTPMYVDHALEAARLANV